MARLLAGGGLHWQGSEQSTPWSLSLGPYEHGISLVYIASTTPRIKTYTRDN
jgi:hypothetical protein